MSTLDALRAFWDERYAAEDFAYGTEPNDFLRQHCGAIRPGGKVLCLADGEGRNGVWLATQGFDVTSVDVSERGLEKARSLAQRCGVAIRTVAADVTAFELGQGWDGIVSIFLHLPAAVRERLHQRCMAALAPTGVFLYEAYGHEQLRFNTGGPREPRLLPQLEEVLAELQDHRIQHQFAGTRLVQEGPLHHGEGYVIQVVATPGRPDRK